MDIQSMGGPAASTSACDTEFIHVAVTRPQTQSGVVEAWATDLDAAVEYARTNRDAPPQSGAIYGSVPGGLTPEADEFIRAVMSDMMDQHQGLPPA